MDLGTVLGIFAHDDKFAAVITMIAVDIILGVAAAVYTRTFALTYIANFARNDVLSKVFPWFVLYAAAKTSHNASLIFGIDLNQVADVVWAGVVLALAGSLISSLRDFGVNIPLPLGRGGTPPAKSPA